MTILLLRPYATFAQGATVNLDNATEASLVAQGRATYTVDPGPAFEPLTATEQQDLRDFLANGATVGSSAASTRSGPLIVAALGDSITQFAVLNGVTINQIAYESQGFLTWAMAFSKGALMCPFVGTVGTAGALVNYNRAISGETAEECLARVPELDALPRKPDLCSILIGTNNLTEAPSQTADSIAEAVIAVSDAVLSRGITPVLCTILPRGNGTAAGWGSLTAGQIATARGRLMEVNRRLRAYAAITPGVRLADTFSAVCNFANATSDADVQYQPDYLHPNAWGAIRVGQAWWNAVESIVPAVVDYFAGTGDAFDATNNPNGSMLTLNYGAGGGTAGTGVSGTVPAGATSDRFTGSAATAVISRGARTAPRPGFATTLAMTGATDAAEFRVYQGDSFVTNTNFVAGEGYYFEQDVLFDGAGANQYGNPDFTIRLNTNTVQVFAALNVAGAQGDIRGTYEFRLRSPIFVAPAGGITSAQMWSVDGIKPSGTATVTRAPPTLRRYDRTAPGAITW